MLKFVLVLLSTCVLCCGSSSTEPELASPRYPLAPGASWEYSYFSEYRRHGPSTGGLTTQQEYGSVTISVQDALPAIGDSRYPATIRFRVDSLLYAYSAPAGFSDTSYTHYAVFDSTVAFVFEEKEQRNLYYNEGAGESLFYSSDESGSSPLDFHLFNLGSVDVFNHPFTESNYPVDWPEKTEGDIRYTTGSLAYEFSVATFNLSDGGLVELTYQYYEGDISFRERKITYKLVSFIPGNSR